jgi:hypothetical protein
MLSPRRKERKEKTFINCRDAEGAEFFLVFAGAALVANNLSNRDEFAAEATPADQDQFNKTGVIYTSSASLRLKQSIKLCVLCALARVTGSNW